MPERFPTLLTSAVLHRIMGWVIVAVGIVALLGVLTWPAGPFPKLVGVVGIVVFLGLSALWAFAIAERIYLAIAVERNTYMARPDVANRLGPPGLSGPEV